MIAALSGHRETLPTKASRSVPSMGVTSGIIFSGPARAGSLKHLQRFRPRIARGNSGGLCRRDLRSAGVGGEARVGPAIPNLAIVDGLVPRAPSPRRRL